MKALPNRLQGLDYSVLQQCMHCGMCLPTCPTYRETRLERNSPRGRIAWMRAIADGEAEMDRAFGEEMYYCLGCLACVSACPAGVDYPTLFETARAQIEDEGLLDHPQRRFWRWLTVKCLFMRPGLLRLAGRGLWLYQASGAQAAFRKLGGTRLLPRRLRELEPMTPAVRRHFSDALVKRREEAGTPRYRVGLLTGCVQDLAFSDINRDTADVLKANGCSVITPRQQHCCGSLHAHNGELDLAKRLARANIDAFPLDELDAIISNAGGCGSHLRHYAKLLADDPAYAAKAHEWDRKLRDIHEWVVEIGIVAPPALGKPLRVVYHPSCHLYHGQGVKTQPEQILRAIPGVTLLPLPDATTCCGSAGIYNITQPVQAAKLQAAKQRNILSQQPDVVATANPGCHLQILTSLRSSGISVVHPISLLARAYREGGWRSSTTELGGHRTSPGHSPVAPSEASS